MICSISALLILVEISLILDVQSYSPNFYLLPCLKQALHHPQYDTETNNTNYRICEEKLEILSHGYEQNTEYASGLWNFEK